MKIWNVLAIFFIGLSACDDKKTSDFCVVSATEKTFEDGRVGTEITCPDGSTSRVLNGASFVSWYDSSDPSKFVGYSNFEGGRPVWIERKGEDTVARWYVSAVNGTAQALKTTYQYFQTSTCLENPHIQLTALEPFISVEVVQSGFYVFVASSTEVTSEIPWTSSSSSAGCDTIWIKEIDGSCVQANLTTPGISYVADNGLGQSECILSNIYPLSVLTSLNLTQPPTTGFVGPLKPVFP